MRRLRSQKQLAITFKTECLITTSCKRFYSMREFVAVEAYQKRQVRQAVIGPMISDNDTGRHTCGAAIILGNLVQNGDEYSWLFTTYTNTHTDRHGS